MPTVTGVKFKSNHKMYYFDPKDLIPAVGEGVIVETARGTEYGTVVMENREVEDKSVVQPLKPILRIATPEDHTQLEKIEAKKPDALRVAAEKIKKHKLEMRLVDAEYTFDGQKLIFYFSAEGRVDFRDLVRDLASYFRVRIELRQIGVRDECKMKGGIAPCGQVCCCNRYLPDFERVSIKMAKNQGLSLSSSKISGYCGRLMCCLSYENPHYVETARRMPKVGSEVTTKDGRGNVVSINFLKETVRVKIHAKDSFEIKDYPAKDIKSKHTMAEELDKDEPVSEELKELLD